MLPPDFKSSEQKIGGPWARSYQHRFHQTEEERANDCPTGATILYMGAAVVGFIAVAMYLFARYLPVR